MEITFATLLGGDSSFQVDDEPDADGWRGVRYGDVQLGTIRLGSANEQREFLEPAAVVDVTPEGIDLASAAVAPQWEHDQHRLLLLKQVCAFLTRS